MTDIYIFCADLADKTEEAHNTIMTGPFSDLTAARSYLKATYDHGYCRSKHIFLTATNP